MTTHEMPLLTVPATDEAAATLADWLIRSVVPTVLDGAGMALDADTLCALAPITARSIGGRRRLRAHERQLDLVITAIEERLQRRSASPSAGEAAVVAGLSIRSLPDEVLDAAAHIAGTIADRGSPLRHWRIGRYSSAQSSSTPDSAPLQPRTCASESSSRTVLC